MLLAKIIKTLRTFSQIIYFLRIFQIIIMVTYDRIFHIFISNNKMTIKSGNVGGNDGVEMVAVITSTLRCGDEGHLSPDQLNQLLFVLDGDGELCRVKVGAWIPMDLIISYPGLVLVSCNQR